VITKVPEGNPLGRKKRTYAPVVADAESVKVCEYLVRVEVVACVPVLDTVVVVKLSVAEAYPADQVKVNPPDDEA
jgi:hypothetical protein